MPAQALHPTPHAYPSPRSSAPPLLPPPVPLLQEFEAVHAQRAGRAGSGLAPTSRGSLWQSMVDLIINVAGSLRISEETTHDALQLCDRLLGSGMAIEEGEANSVAAALLLLTCKQGGAPAAAAGAAAAVPGP